MLVDVRAFATPATLVFAIAVTVGVILTKWIASKAVERAFGYGTDEGWTMFGLSVPHAAGTMAIVLVGFDVGLLDQAEVNAIVLVILVTSLLGPWLTEKYGRQVAMREEQKPYEPSEAPQCILIPISNPATEDALLDLALAIRATGSEEPLHPLMVVRQDGYAGTEAQVAEAERLLGHAVIYAAGVDVPVVPLAPCGLQHPPGYRPGNHGNAQLGGGHWLGCRSLGRNADVRLRARPAPRADQANSAGRKARTPAQYHPSAGAGASTGDRPPPRLL